MRPCSVNIRLHGPHAFQKLNCLHGFTRIFVEKKSSLSASEENLNTAAGELFPYTKFQRMHSVQRIQLLKLFPPFLQPAILWKKRSRPAAAMHEKMADGDADTGDTHMKLSNVQASTAPTWGIHIEFPIILMAFAGCPSQSWSKRSSTKLETKG